MDPRAQGLLRTAVTRLHAERELQRLDAEAGAGEAVARWWPGRVENVAKG
jgi:hypothetical protein